MKDKRQKKNNATAFKGIYTKMRVENASLAQSSIKKNFRISSLVAVNNNNILWLYCLALWLWGNLAVAIL